MWKVVTAYTDSFPTGGDIPGRKSRVWNGYNLAVGCGSSPQAICSTEYLTNGNFGNGLDGDETQWFIHPHDVLNRD